MVKKQMVKNLNDQKLNGQNDWAKIMIKLLQKLFL
jgi:hypothetical protein